ncbi:putative F-box protein At3g16210 [Panicum virgatum]|uniref:putative F-box protein At3g16210 n=1 Tax=Panicum virgatum TaxID=38727 RepID=UPI0019D62049|nr:putative F-box protein At3g16210 [Panicum virgatum]
MSEGATSPALEPGPPPLPDNDDLHREIFLRLPPLPSSLPRASLVCKRWRRLLSDPAFLRRFRAHHRAPPLLGFFADEDGDIEFVPTLRRPDRIPRERFSLPRRDGGDFLSFLGCRHGLALLIDRARLEAVVWNPVTGSRRRVPFPPGFDQGRNVYRGAVLSSSGDGHVHGDCRLIPFKLVLVHHADLRGAIVSACLYESESGTWGNVSSMAIPHFSRLHQPGVLVGNQVYWMLLGTSDILEFDLSAQRLSVIQKPQDAHVKSKSGLQALRTEDNKLGLATISELGIQLWGRETNLDGVGRWVPLKTVELDKLRSISPSMRIQPSTILGFDEDNNAFFICTNIGLYMIQLESLQFTRLFDGDMFTAYYPYTSFYTAGLGIGGGDDRAEILNNA